MAKGKGPRTRRLHGVRVRQRAKGLVYHARVRVAGRERFEYVTTLPLDASVAERRKAETLTERRATQRQTEAEAGTYRAQGKLSLGKLTDRFLAAKATSRFRAERVRVWLDYFGSEVLASRVTPAMVNGFAEHRESLKRRDGTPRVGVSTLRKDLVGLSSLFRWAIREGLLTSNPADPSVTRKRPAEPKPRQDALTEAEVERLLAALATDDALLRLVRWCLGTGWDSGDAMGLRWPTIDRAEGGVLTDERPKTGQPRVTVLTPELRRVLAECRQGVQHVEGFVFVDDDAQPFSRWPAARRLRDAYERAGIESARPFKRLRHTFITRAVRSNANPQHVARLAGHSGTGMLEIYTRIATEEVAATAHAIAASVEGEGS